MGGPKSNDCVLTRERRGRSETQTPRSHVTTEAEAGDVATAWEHVSRQELEDAGNPPLEPPEGAWPGDTVVSDSGWRNHRRLTFCCFKLPGSWSSVAAAPGDSYTLSPCPPLSCPAHRKPGSGGLHQPRAHSASPRLRQGPGWWPLLCAPLEAPDGGC